MTTKLAIVMTPYLRSFVESTIKELGSEYNVSVYLYEHFSEIGEIYSSIPADVNGVLTSGMYPARAIKLAHPESGKVIKPFNTDDAGFYHLILQLLNHNRSLDFSRIHADFIDLLGIGLYDYLFNERKVTFSDVLAEKVDAMNEEELYAIEDEVYQKHITLYKEGKTDFSITRFSSLVPRLQRAGVPVYFAYPTHEYMANVIKEAARETRIMEMENNLPAVINVAIPPVGDDISSVFGMERKFAALHELLMDFNVSSSMECVLQRTVWGFEAFTNKKTLIEATDNFSLCPLGHMASKMLDFSINIGYGIGHSLSQARINAGNAKRKSEHCASGSSYLINEHSELIGPLGDKDALVVTKAASPHDFEAAKRVGLSPLTVQKIRAAVAKQHNGRITAQQLSAVLSITKRSANRFLKALHEAGVIKSVEENRSTTKGRPEKVFCFAE